MKIVELMKQSVAKYDHNMNGDWVIAYSGGVDSRVMLDVLCSIKPDGKKIKLLHVNHGLNVLAEAFS